MMKLIKRVVLGLCLVILLMACSRAHRMTDKGFNSIQNASHDVAGPVVATGKTVMEDFGVTTALRSGIPALLVIAELQSNFSSLLYDKTQAKYDVFTVRPIKMIPDDAKFYVIPARYKDALGNETYDETYPRLFSGYVQINNFGKVVNKLEDADYVVVVQVLESVDRAIGKNSSSVAISIYEPDESPAFFASVSVSSASDKNFFYKPTKYARPVKYLTLKGMEKLFSEALPQVFI